MLEKFNTKIVQNFLMSTFKPVYSVHVIKQQNKEHGCSVDTTAAYGHYIYI